MPSVTSKIGHVIYVTPRFARLHTGSVRNDPTFKIINETVEHYHVQSSHDGQMYKWPKDFQFIKKIKET